MRQRRPRHCSKSEPRAFRKLVTRTRWQLQVHAHKSSTGLILLLELLEPLQGLAEVAIANVAIELDEYAELHRFREPLDDGLIQPGTGFASQADLKIGALSLEIIGRRQHGTFKVEFEHPQERIVGEMEATSGVV